MDEQEGHPPEETQATPEQEQQTPAPAPQAAPEDLSALKARLEEKESFIGRQSKEIGDLRGELGYLRTMMEGLQSGRQQEPEPAPQVGTPQFNWENPAESVNRLIEERLKAAEAQRQRTDQERRAREAQVNYYEGKESAYKSDKYLYEGIEQEVERAVYESYRNGILNERSLASPETWKTAAQLIRLRKGEFDRLKPPATKPMTAPQSETPTAKPMRFEDVPITVDEETRRWGRGQGLTDKQIEEIIKGEAQAKAKGQNVAQRSYGE